MSYNVKLATCKIDGQKIALLVGMKLKEVLYYGEWNIIKKISINPIYLEFWMG
jgi:hypothetical protein